MAVPNESSLRRIALAFCNPPRATHLVTLRDGEPVGRTIFSRLDESFTLVIVSQRAFKRLEQVAEHPAMLALWTEPLDGVSYPKAIYARGDGRVLFGEAAAEWYGAWAAVNGPMHRQTAETVRLDLGIILMPVREFRFEGFAAEGTTLTRDELASGSRLRLPNSGLADSQSAADR